jgi:hypothetical protein
MGYAATDKNHSSGYDIGPYYSAAYGHQEGSHKCVLDKTVIEYRKKVHGAI